MRVIVDLQRGDSYSYVTGRKGARGRELEYRKMGRNKREKGEGQEILLGGPVFVFIEVKVTSGGKKKLV